MRPAYIIFISAFLLFTTARVFSQDTTRHDPNIRLTMVLVDSIGIPHQFSDTSFHFMYKFEIEKLYRGEYHFQYVYVGASDAAMRHFNWVLNTGVRYYWCLSDTKEWYKGIPIYRHSCSW